MNVQRQRGGRLVGVAVVVGLALCDRVAPDAAGQIADNPVPTFARDIAPIIHANCTECHNAGGPGPFELRSYEDVRRRAKQIGIVTSTGFMPPWLPAAGDVEFLGKRGLTAEQIAMIQTWVTAGTPEGDPGKPYPPPPAVAGDWKFGTPDLVLTMAEPFELAADTRDVIRSFVLPVRIPQDRFVRAIELQPSNPRIVHHAAFSIDLTGSARMLDQAEPGPGYPGMGDINFVHAGSFGAWSPAMRSVALPDGFARLLPASCDLVMEVHFRTTGKPETEQPAVGLYFTKAPPASSVTALTLGSYCIDVAPGDREYIVRDEFTLPVDVMLVEISPHAHYACRRMLVTGELPAQDGQSARTLTLLRIDDWDFNWQQPYRCAQPLKLLAGTKLRMEYQYDNSAENLRNPHNPPQRIYAGHDVEDEMALLFLHVAPARQEDMPALQQAYRAALIERMNKAIEFRNQRLP